MQWFWRNVPLAAIFVAIRARVPLWLVLKQPDTGPEPPVPEVAGQSPVTERAGSYHPRHASDSAGLAEARS